MPDWVRTQLGISVLGTNYPENGQSLAAIYSLGKISERRDIQKSEGKRYMYILFFLYRPFIIVMVHSLRLDYYY